MVNCKFCELLVKDLKEGVGHFKDMDKSVRQQLLSVKNNPDFKENLKDSDHINEATAFVRGFPLCSKHANTIKSDNKKRARKGLDIPADLSITTKLMLYDWTFAVLFIGMFLIIL